MGRIDINTGAVRQATTAVTRASVCISGLGGLIATVRAVASPIGAISRALDGSFIESSRTIGEVQRDIMRLTSTVNSIAASYESAELANTSRMRGTAMRTGFGGGGGWFRPAIIPAFVLFPGGIGLIGGLAIIGGITKNIRNGTKPVINGSSSSFGTEVTGSAGGKFSLLDKFLGKSDEYDAYLEAKGKAEGWLWKGEGSVDYGDFHADGTVKAGDAYAEGDASVSLFKDGELQPNLGANGKVGLTALSAEGNFDYGAYHSDGTVKVGDVYAKGDVGFSLFKDGEFNPGIGAGVAASATALSAEGNARLGSEDFDVHAAAEGKVATASASAEARVGADGVTAKAKAEAYLATGEVSGGLDLGIVKLDLSLEGKLGGAGAEGGFEASTTSVEGKIGLGLGAGAALGIKADWSGAPKFIDHVVNKSTEAGKAVNSFFSNVGKGISSIWNGR